MNASEQAIEGDGPIRWTRADTCWLVSIGLVGLALRLGYALQYAGHRLGRSIKTRCFLTCWPC
jgi:hypothetical protein